MRARLRLSRTHDYELYCLYRTLGERQFSGLLRRLLVCYKNKEVPESITVEVWDIPENGDKGAAVTCYLSVPEETEEILQCVKENRRGAFIKALARSYLANVLMSVYFVDEQAPGACIVPVVSGAPPTPVKNKPKPERSTSKEVEEVLPEVSEPEPVKNVSGPETQIAQIPESENVQEQVDDLNAMLNLFGQIQAL